MKKLTKALLTLAAGAGAVLAHLFIKDRMEYGTSYKRPGRWY